jgi:hypothetical protein
MTRTSKTNQQKTDMSAPAASAMFRKVVRRQQLQSAEHALKSIVKLSAVVPFYGAGHTGLRFVFHSFSQLRTFFFFSVGCVSYPRAVVSLFLLSRKFLQHQVPLFRFNTPTLATQFSNAKEKEVPTVLKLEKSTNRFHFPRSMRQSFSY